MVAPWAYEETIQLPGAVRLPVELEPPEGFAPADPDTWPKVAGRLEYVEGKLLYMVTEAGATRVAAGGQLPEPRALPRLAPAVDDLFVQLAGG
jgi:hypothetical protein